MIPIGRAQYQMQSQNLFRYAPITKAWICSLLSCSATYMYLNLYTTSPPAPSLRNIIDCKGVGKLFTSKLFFHTPSLMIAGIVLLYYARWIERRFGSKKFMNFILIIGIQAAVMEISMFYAISQLFNYDPSTMYFAAGPFALLSALYANFIFEIPVVPYARIFGIPLSIHNLPLLMFVQLIGANRPSMIACIAGLISGLIYRSHFAQIGKLNLIPSFIVQSLQSTTNPFGWLIDKFINIGEDNRGNKILPVAATIERQRIEIIDEYERRLMLNQMQRMHRAQLNGSHENQLHFLNRLFQNQSPGEPPSEDRIRQLMDMGFGNRQMVIDALRQNDNDTSAAANALLHQNQ
uniref:UBA domain-containing protein n=2 Tax=Ascaris TaxID=6251 RepID=A0A0M3I032_ASCLU